MGRGGGTAAHRAVGCPFQLMVEVWREGISLKGGLRDSLGPERYPHPHPLGRCHLAGKV